MNNAKEVYNIDCLKKRLKAIQDFYEENKGLALVQELWVYYKVYYDQLSGLLNLSKDSASLSEKIQVVVDNNYDLEILKFMHSDDDNKGQFHNALNALGDLYVEAYRNQANVEGFKFALIVISGILAGFISGIIIEAAKQEGLMAVGIGVGCALIAAYLSYQQCFDYTQQKKQFMSEIGEKSKNIAESFWGADDSDTTPLLVNKDGALLTKQKLQDEFLNCVKPKDNVPS